MDNNQNPIVYNAPQPASSPKREWFKPKYLIYVLVFVIIIELIWGLKTLITPVPTKKVSTAPVVSANVSLTLLSSKKDYKVGDNLIVDIDLSTNLHKTIGTDIVLKYDPKYLEATSGAFIRGGIYPDYPAVEVDNAKGVINASGIINPNEGGFAGSGIFGEVVFKAKTAGTTDLKLDFIKGTTNDSNVFELGASDDILKEVNNLEINIQ